MTAIIVWSALGIGIGLGISVLLRRLIDRRARRREAATPKHYASRQEHRKETRQRLKAEQRRR